MCWVGHFTLLFVLNLVHTFQLVALKVKMSAKFLLRQDDPSVGFSRQDRCLDN